MSSCQIDESVYEIIHPMKSAIGVTGLHADTHPSSQMNVYAQHFNPEVRDTLTY